jgi:hypothetical protein
LRFALVFQDERTSIKQGFNRRSLSSRHQVAWSTIALKTSRGKPWVEPSCFSADIGIPFNREPISTDETSPAASQYAAPDSPAS